MSRRTFTILSMVAAVALTVSTLSAGSHEGEGEAAVTVRGEILDMACYVAQEAKGAEHAGCAKRCVKGGQPMGLLADDGTVYLLYASHQKADAFEQAKELAGEKVELKGKKADRAGIHGLEVHAVKGL